MGGVDDPLYAYALKKENYVFLISIFHFRLIRPSVEFQERKMVSNTFYVLNRAQQAFVLYLNNY